MILPTFLLLLLSPAHARCKEPGSNEQIEQLVREGTEGWAYSKLAPFNRARVEIQQAIGCMDGVVAGRTLAGYYRLEGLAAYMDGTDGTSAILRNFQVACLLDPSYTFPNEVVPEGHEIIDMYNTACGRPAFATDPLPVTKYIVYVDGFAVERYPLGRPMAFQVMTEGGKLRFSGLLDADSLADLPPVINPAKGAVASRWLGYSALGVAVTAGGMAALSFASERRFDAYTDQIAAGRLNVSESNAVDDSYQQANTFGVLAQALGGAAIGLGATAVIVRW